MTKVVIDGKDIDVPDHYTLLQACEAAGAEIPRFCFHERLSIAGNCRMCLVELKGGPPKPLASCAFGVRDCRPGPNGEPPEVLTKSPMVKKAREGVMEFLLINHPLDCPICDQGGECDLQDQAMAYGINKNRFVENKRAVEDKYIGPLVRTKMTRCIHCTRCVRFTTEVAGVSEMGMLGRGEDAEIVTYLDAALGSELQGNIIDLCPVGALTSRPYQDSARSWELNNTESIDVMDAVGSSIRVDARGREVMRILPRLNESVNEEWISDKTRFVWDGLGTQRLDRPYVRVKEKLVAVSWSEAFAEVKSMIDVVEPGKIGAIAGDLASVEDMFALKSLMRALGSKNYDCREPGSVLDPARGRASYIFNSSMEGIEKSDALLIVGSDLRMEASILNARIRKRSHMGNYPIGILGVVSDPHYDCVYLGGDANTLGDLTSGKNKFVTKLERACRPAIIIGQGALNRPDSKTILSEAASLAVSTGVVSGEWNGFNIVHTAASRVGGLDIGFVPEKGGMETARIMKNMQLTFLLGADEIDMSALKGNVVYIGSHGDRGAHRADIILPAATYTEKTGIYVNTEGRVQRANRSVFAPGEAKEDWAIIRALSAVLGKTLPFDHIDDLHDAIFREFPHMADLDNIVSGDVDDIMAMAVKSAGRKAGKIMALPLTSPVKDFYMTNPVARASRVMAECSALSLNRANNARMVDKQRGKNLERNKNG